MYQIMQLENGVIIITFQDIQNIIGRLYADPKYAGVVQLVERLICNQYVGSSSLFISSKWLLC